MAELNNTGVSLVMLSTADSIQCGRDVDSSCCAGWSEAKGARPHLYLHDPLQLQPYATGASTHPQLPALAGSARHQRHNLPVFRLIRCPGSHHAKPDRGSRRNGSLGLRELKYLETDQYGKSVAAVILPVPQRDADEA